MNEAKIRLSPAEMDLVNNAEIILTKNAIIQKAMHLLSRLQEKQQSWLETNMPEFGRGSSPKISKGENYRGLPYLVLDYPRIFETDGLFMIRSMFWWGNFFSITLHATGHFAKGVSEKFALQYSQLKDREYHYCINEDPWQHHFEENNYRLIADVDDETFRGFVRNSLFIKLAKKFPLSEWDNAVELLLEEFRFLAGVSR